MTGATGGKDSFGSSFSTDTDGCGAWLALGLGAGGKAAIAGGVLMTGAAIGAFVDGGVVAVFCASVTGAVIGTVVAFVDGDVVAVFCASVTGAGGGVLCGAGAATGLCASVTTDPVLTFFGARATRGLGAFVSFAVVVAVVAAGAVAGDGAIDVAVVTGPAAGLIASVEISARKATAAVVNLLMIDAIISVVGFVDGASVAVGDGRSE